MFGRFIEFNCLVIMALSFKNLSCEEQRSTHQAMPHHARDRGLLLLSERQELNREFAKYVAASDKARDKKTVEDREQQQWVFRRLAEGFCLFDQEARTLRSCLGLRRSVPF